MLKKFLRIAALVILWSLVSVFSQPKTLPTPASDQEMIQDIDRYVELFASANALVSLNALDYIPYFGTKAIPALLRGLSHPSSQVRCFSAIACSRFSDQRCIPPLIELLNDNSGLDLQVLSDDGQRIHSSYGGPLPHYLRQNALIALHRITGHSFGYFGQNSKSNANLIEKWQSWWQSRPADYQPPSLKLFSNQHSPQTLYPLPDYAGYLQGVTICIDPGHGGERNKPGYKRGPSGNREAESNLRLARYLKDFLQRCNARVLMTRDSDRFVPLKHRPEIASRYHADLFVSIHHNWTPRYTAQATTIWYHFHPDYNPASMDLARYIFQEFTRRVPMREMDRAMGLKADNLIYQSGFSVLRNLAPEVPGVLCELAFFSNLETELKMRDCDFLQNEAYGVFLGLARYLYAGIPHWQVMKPSESILTTPRPSFQVQVLDGLEQRKEWGYQRIKIFARHLSVEIDGKSVPFDYDRAKGILRFIAPEPLSPGSHALQVFIININKNHNWPKIYRFTIN